MPNPGRCNDGVGRRRPAALSIVPPEDLDQLLDLAPFVEGHTEPGLLLGPDGEQVRWVKAALQTEGRARATVFMKRAAISFSPKKP